MASDLTRNARHRNSYPLDLSLAEASIRQFNKSPAFCAADGLLYRHFANPGAPLDLRAIAEGVVLVDGLYGTKVYLEPGAHDRIIERLTQGSARLLSQLHTLDERALEDRPEEVVRVSQEALALVLKSANGEKVRQHYSFATKFFHWVTRHHFPIMDSRSRNGIIKIQQRSGSLTPAARIHPDPQLPYEDDYRRWIHFFSDVISGLVEKDRETLCRKDYHTQQPPFRVKHSLVRILDKVLYVQGGDGVITTNAPAVPPSR